jgi:hypothetical protein
VARATSTGRSEHLGMTSPYPSVDRLPCRLRRLKANEPAGLPLADIGSVNRIAVGRHVIDAQWDEVTATQFAVNGEIEHGQVARAFLQIQLGAYRPHVTGPQGRLWASDLPLNPGGPRDAGSGVGFGHGDLPACASDLPTSAEYVS